MGSDGLGWSPLVMSVADVTVVMDRPRINELRGELQQALTEADPAVGFLALLTAGGVRDLPTFAYVGVEGSSVRILLRGDLVAVTRSAAGAASTVAAGSVSTWTEVVHADCVEVEVRALPGGDDDVVTVVSVGRPPTRPSPANPPSTPAPVTPAAPVGDETVIPSEFVAVDPAEPTVAFEDDDDDDTTGVVPAVAPAPASDEVDLSHLFETSFVGVEAAAVRPEEPSEPTDLLADLPPPLGAPVAGAPPKSDLSRLPPPTGAPVAAPPPPLISGVPGQVPVPGEPAPLGDHDGLTIGPGALAALRGQIGTHTSALATGARVQAVSCPAGHLNPPHADRCRGCGAAIADRTVHVVARPSLGRLVFDFGLVSEIDRPLLIGRKPTTEGIVPGGEVPGLVVVPDPEGSLSRVHAEVRIEEWEVLLVDQSSTNGTLVELPGQAPVLLRPMEPCLLSAGSKITFADAAVCHFETGPR